MKTSARNVFAGRITELKQHDFMVAVSLCTASGLPITALITDESAARLDLQQGKIALATIKAPLVLVEKPTQGALAGNHYAGIVKRVRRTDFMQEVTVALASGEEVCALLHDEEGTLFTEGEEAVVSFKAFAVVIGLG